MTNGAGGANIYESRTIYIYIYETLITKGGPTTLRIGARQEGGQGQKGGTHTPHNATKGWGVTVSILAQAHMDPHPPTHIHSPPTPPGASYVDSGCKAWRQGGACTRGDDCTFAHGEKEREFWLRASREAETATAARS